MQNFGAVEVVIDNNVSTAESCWSHLPKMQIMHRFHVRQLPQGTLESFDVNVFRGLHEYLFDHPLQWTNCGQNHQK